jgi:type IV secretory pathway TrbL component
MFEIIDIILQPFKDYLNSILNDIEGRTQGLINSAFESSLFLFEVILPSVVYSIIFFGIGIILLTVGIGQVIDTIAGVPGTGFIISGGLLLLFAWYYKSKLKVRTKPGINNIGNK